MIVNLAYKLHFYLKHRAAAAANGHDQYVAYLLPIKLSKSSYCSILLVAFMCACVYLIEHHMFVYTVKHTRSANEIQIN